VMMVDRIAEAEQRLAGVTPEHVNSSGIDQPLQGSVDRRQTNRTTEVGVQVLGRKRLGGAPQGGEHGRALPGGARRLRWTPPGHGAPV
jgi:hypothetical protein